MNSKKQAVNQTNTTQKLLALRQNFDSEFAVVEKQYQTAHDELEQLIKKPMSTVSHTNKSS
ncbi:hypothetical protein BK004_04405 [bacterium CG10_46_32]|nr:MAG: hypothetical protein BK004_04405 [bacterium CG10_46_32]PIR55751.1 MAG: hypothetical protein COU73_04445 [Parcubacteria group bacterium CG10_big_fil_rev_8_21_14_0_10_46_32]